MFSVIIPTRDRPELLRRAVTSAMAQAGCVFEVVVVDDGSAPGPAEEGGRLVHEAGGTASFHRLPPHPGGHGPAFARNLGIERAQYPYVAFLDDDDEWTDTGYLGRVAATLRTRPEGFDLHLSDQVAVQDGAVLDRVVWTEDLKRLLQPAPAAGDAGPFPVDMPTLMRSGGFCHLNTTVVRRDFFRGLGGFDEGLRYESDRDFYLRAIDAAGTVLYSPVTISRHYVPDRTRTANVSTASNQVQRLLHQLRIVDKAILFARTAEMRAYGKRHKGYTLKRLATVLAEAGEGDRALFYAREAAMVAPNPKWMAYLALLWARRRS